MLKKIDVTLLVVVFCLFFFGLIMVYSASAIFSERVFDGDPFHVFKNQLTWGIIGLLIMYCAIYIPTRLYNKFAFVIAGITVILLGLVLIPGIGVKILGARRWIQIKGVSFQPSEFAKVSIIILLAKLFKDARNLKDSDRIFVPGLISILVISGLIILEPDFGTAFEIFMLGVILIYVAGTRFSKLVYLSMVAVPFIAGLIMMAGYRKERILAFLDPASVSSTSGYQIIQSLIAVGTGGVTGLGLGNSIQKLFYLPQAHSDYIFSIIGEELGLIGTLMVMGLFIIILFRGFIIGKNSDVRFNQILALGITFHIFLQVILNIGITLGLLPPKGLPLPFFSAGGTSLIITLFEMGILLRISIENNLDPGYAGKT